MNDNIYNVDPEVWNEWTSEQRNMFNDDFEVFTSNPLLFQPLDVDEVPPKTWEEISFHFAFYNAQHSNNKKVA